MNRNLYIKGIALQKLLNLSEYLIYPIAFESVPKDVIIEKNIAYGNPEEYELCNFIYQKNSIKKNTKQPLMIMIHGGGWISGLKDLRNFYCYHAAQEGYFVANIDYHPAPKKVFPYQLKQIFKAIDFVLDKAADYNVDTSRVVVAGESAGGYFVLEVSAIVKHKELFEKLGIEFRHRDTFDVTANICNCGAFDMVKLVDSNFPNMKSMIRCYTDMSLDEIANNPDSEKIQLLSPTAYIDEHFPPTMIIYASHDALRKESFALAELLKELKVPYKMYKGTGILSLHAAGIATKTKQGADCFRQTMDFINGFIKR